MKQFLFFNNRMPRAIGAYKLPPFGRHKENSLQRGPEGGVPILYLIQKRGREIDERSI